MEDDFMFNLSMWLPVSAFTLAFASGFHDRIRSQQSDSMKLWVSVIFALCVGYNDGAFGSIERIALPTLTEAALIQPHITRISKPHHSPIDINCPGFWG